MICIDVPTVVPWRTQPTARASDDPKQSPGSDESPFSSIVDVVAVPEIAFVLVASGMLLLAIWVALPHLWMVLIIASSTLGAAMVGLWAMPVGPAAAVLLVLALTSFAMEMLSLPGYLLHATGGAFALALAGLCLEKPWSGAHPAVVVPTALLVGAAIWLSARGSWRAIRADPFHVSPRMVGRELVVLSAIEPNTGHAVVAGQLWTIHDPTTPLRAGAHGHVTGFLNADVLTIRQT
jgi:membrane-bound serine protease (ClpP class)